MGKRNLNGDQPGPKRPKLHHDAEAAPANVDKIHSAKQVQDLLAFSQDAVPQLKGGIQSFKAFLESIVYAQDKSTTATELGILRDLLASQRPVDADSSYFPSLAQAWSFAVQTNNEALQSQIPALFALLLRTISADLKFRDHGLLLGKSLLQINNAKLIAKGLSAPKNKEHIISPCLRLLIELVNFDGGSLAKQIWTQRQYTLDAPSLARNIGFWKKAPVDAEEARRKPSVRSNAIRYVLANFKFQHTSAKAELGKNPNIFKALFENLKHDSTELLTEAFHVLKNHLFGDTKVSRQTKAFVMHDRNLISIASLYRDSTSADAKKAAQLAHEFLLYVCTRPEAGVLKPSSWYPPGAEQALEANPADKSGSEINLGLDSIDWYQKFNSKVPVRNRALAGLTQSLRPFASLQESGLLLDIFKACPELMASYFKEKSNFSFDPKLTATWIGYSAFVFSAVALPVPSRIAPTEDLPRVPPPVSIVLENILPTALSQSVLTRCLHQKSDLITFFAIRILATAFQKLQVCLDLFRKAGRDIGPLWEDAERRLVSAFSARCPAMKDVIASWRSTPKANRMQREAVLRLLKLYYQATPQIAMQDKLDVSLPLNEALASFDDDRESASDDAQRMRILELNHLLQIAHWSPDVRWFNKAGAASLSPVASLIKILVQQPAENLPAEMQGLLPPIMREYTLLQDETSPTGLQALLASLRDANLDSVLPFLDDALDRTVKRPVKYEDDIDALAGKDADPGPLSLVWATLAEQWPFAVGRDAHVAAGIAQWLARYTALSKQIGEDERLLDKIHSKLVDAASSAPKLKKALSLPSTLPQIPVDEAFAEDESASTTQAPEAATPFTLPSYLNPQTPPESGLHEWTTHSTLADAIAANTLPPLITCLSSPYPEVRAQSLTSLSQIHTRLTPAPASTPSTAPSDTLRFYFLLGELLDTCAPYAPGPIPSIVPAYAAAAAAILLQPTHPLYPKVNHFHSRAPAWDVSRLAHYWLRQCLFTPASDPIGSGSGTTRAAKAAEISFLLGMLLQALQCADDVDTTLRRRGLFEHLFGLAAGVDHEDARFVEQVLRIVWRVALVGGSTTMITRAGVLAWLAGLLAGVDDRATAAGDDEHEERLYTTRGIKALAGKIWETCDQERVRTWSGAKGAYTGLQGLGLADE